jgi:carbon-monoxide dehydrogenase large subunit
MRVQITINGKVVANDIPARTSLADFLRERLNLTATHLGCEHGICGACTIVVNGEPQRSCLTLAVACDGYDVRTLEGLRNDEIMVALCDSFHRNHGLQCGFCTPGMLIAAWDLIRRGKAGSDAEIRAGLAGNLCRCTGYTDIIVSVRKAAESRGTPWDGGRLARPFSSAKSGRDACNAGITHALAKSAQGVGARLLRKEDAHHLSGHGQFVSDLKLPGTHDVAFVRSPHAHARIKAISVPPRLEGYVFTGPTLPRLSDMRAVPQVSGFRVAGYPPLATGKVRFVGEIIAACVAPTRAEAEDMASQVDIEYEPLPPIVDARSVLDGSQVLLHEGWPDNLFISRLFEGGNVDEAKQRADIVVERHYRMNRQAAVPMEGRAVLAYRDQRLDELVVYDSTQVPHIIRLGLSEVLGIEERAIRVIAPDVGGGFGSKARLLPEEVIVAALGMELDHPVRWVEDRAEHFLASTHSRDHDYKVTAYADRTGVLLAIDAELIVDAGAYALWPNGPFLETGMAARNIPGPYNIRNWRVKSFTVATNKAPIGPYRGVGRPGACFAIERTVDEVARAVGRDPFDVRLDNLVRPEQMPYRTIAGLLFDNGDYTGLLKLCSRTIDVTAVRERQKRVEPDGRLIGLGFACYSEQTGHGCGEWVSRGSPFIPGFESCNAQFRPDGTLVLLVGIQSHGQGLETTLAQIAHQELGIDPAKISVRHGDTGLSPFGNGTIASRSMVMAGGAVAKTSRLLRDKIVRIGAHLLQCDVAAARCEDGAVHGPNSSVSFEEIAHVAHLRMDMLPEGAEPLLSVTGTYQPGIDSGVFSFAAHAAVVAVDPRTGLIEVLDYGVAEDCGTVINPMIVEGQIRGGVVQGIGTALCEEIPYDAQGQPLVGTFSDYLMPGSAEMPAIKVVHTETPSPFTEYGVKGMGEGGAIAPAAAIANAVRDALASIGAEVNETPITPKRVFAAIRAATGPDAANNPGGKG